MPSLPYLASVIVSGLLTGTVYGLMALGLSAIFGVMRLVNFAHGDIMALAMYAAVIAFERFSLDPFVALPLIAALFAVVGYALHRAFTNRFVRRPEHIQMLLMIALATIVGNVLLLGFGPDARSVQPSYALDSIAWGPILIDKARGYAAIASLTATALLAA